ncbi:MAG TPA: hypothetical protein VKT28_01915 [Puia sp.]|nr:hypothetical protein [Puia sp.]
MNTKTDRNYSGRYLLCGYVFSEKMIKKIKADVIAFMVNKDKGDKYFEFINWNKAENEIAVLTMHTCKDIPLPKKYDIVFHLIK